MNLIFSVLISIIKSIKSINFEFFKLVLLPPLKLIVFAIVFNTILSFTISQINYINYKFKMANQMERMIQNIPKKYREYTMDLCDKYNIPIYIVSRVINIESQWNPNAISRYNRNGTRDYGLGQLNSRYIGSFVKWFYKGKEKFNVFNWKHNLQVAIGFLASLNKSFYGNWHNTVCAYNAGPNAVRYGRVPASTFAYAKKILSPVSI